MEACSHTAGQKAAGEERCCPFTSEETEAQTTLFQSPRPLSVDPLSLEPSWQWASEPGLSLLCGAVGWPLSPGAQAGLGVVPPHTRCLEEGAPVPNLQNGPKDCRSSEAAVARPRAIREGFSEEASQTLNQRVSGGLPGSRRGGHTVSPCPLCCCCPRAQSSPAERCGEGSTLGQAPNRSRSHPSCK